MALPAFAVAACSAPGGPAAGSGSPSFTDRMSSMFFGAPASPQAGATPASAQQDDQPDCPPLDVRQGASTITVHGPGEPVATNVRYQASVGQLARECAVLGATMAAKVGLQGRIILGPAGGPGRLTVPIRFALVREGPEPRTIWTQLYHVPVDIPPGQTNVPFTHVDDNISFPKPTSEEADAYVFYVGFDQLALREPPRGRRR